MDLNFFGNFLCERRKEKGFSSQRKMAEALNVSHATLARAEEGSHIPRNETLYKIAALFDMRYDEFLVTSKLLNTGKAELIDTKINNIIKYNLVEKSFRCLLLLITDEKYENGWVIHDPIKIENLTKNDSTNEDTETLFIENLIKHYIDEKNSYQIKQFHLIFELISNSKIKKNTFVLSDMSDREFPKYLVSGFMEIEDPVKVVNFENEYLSKNTSFEEVVDAIRVTDDRFIRFQISKEDLLFIRRTNVFQASGLLVYKDLTTEEYNLYKSIKSDNRILILDKNFEIVEEKRINEDISIQNHDFIGEVFELRRGFNESEGLYNYTNSF
ncbi:helix-turn-helix domain-containing protein [Alkalibacillus sp. S2W]|uniref:helix-turn-helix domain-containing protein n=1 Tax=Alkalibacillus sp. S2W TaxID=3386553 RepID=UPI00398D175C